MSGSLNTQRTASLPLLPRPPHHPHRKPVAVVSGVVLCAPGVPVGNVDVLDADLQRESRVEVEFCADAVFGRAVEVRPRAVVAEETRRLGEFFHKSDDARAAFKVQPEFFPVNRIKPHERSQTEPPGVVHGIADVVSREFPPNASHFLA